MSGKLRLKPESSVYPYLALFSINYLARVQIQRVEKNKGAIKKSSLARETQGMMLGALFREGNVGQVMNAIFVNDSNTEGWQIQDEAFLELL